MATIDERLYQLETQPDLLQSVLAGHVGRSNHVMRWVNERLHGLPLPSLPDDKRQQLAGACLHVAVEHSKSIVVLVEATMYGSALALVRLMLEAYVRGMWLMYGATPKQVDQAGRDQFERTFAQMVDEIESTVPRGLSGVKGAFWNRLCSFTHTGYQQIGARLTASGLGDEYAAEELIGALGWADGVQLLCAVEFAAMARNPAIGSDIADFTRSVLTSTTSGQNIETSHVIDDQQKAEAVEDALSDPRLGDIPIASRCTLPCGCKGEVVRTGENGYVRVHTPSPCPSHIGYTKSARSLDAATPVSSVIRISEVVAG
jgi:hypothetical protein